LVAVESARLGVRIAVAHIHPKRAVVPQHAAHLAEDADHGRDVRLGRRLEAELLVNAPRAALPANVAKRHPRCDRLLAFIGPEMRPAVEPERALVADEVAVQMVAIGVATVPARRAIVAQAPIRRRRDDAVYRGRWEPRQELAAIALEEPDAHAGVAPCRTRHAVTRHVGLQ
jgi:hypothetical protein